MKAYKLVNFCEFDPYAVKSYCAIHKVTDEINLGDITLVDEDSLEPFTMICGGSPCQDFSVAGKQKGSMWTCKTCNHEYNPLIVHWSTRGFCPVCNSADIEKTRSSLLVEFLRVIRAKKPGFGIYENVKNIVGKQFKDTFELFTNELNEYGYNVYWKVLNAKDYGIPQNRERVYLLFIKKELDNGKFVFPQGFDNGVRLKDILETSVSGKYYVPQSKLDAFINDLHKNDTLLSGACHSGDAVNKIQQIGNLVSGGKWDNPQRGRVYSTEGCCPSLNGQGGGGNLEPKILPPTQAENKCNIRIRKLTPKECFRLMGFSDDAYERASECVSNSQLYRQTGNSIVVDVLYYIFVELYKVMPHLFEDLRLSSFFSGIGAFEVALDRLYEGVNAGNFTFPQDSGKIVLRGGGRSINL